MSFTKLKRLIERGDTIILYLSVNSMFPIKVEPQVINRRGDLVDHIFQTIYGALRVADLEGLRYGSKVKLSRGWGFALAPTCDLWTLSLPHRTQILYSPDIAMVLTQLQLKPGSRAIEAGTGSGSLSHAILRTVKPNGSLLTFDFHEERAKVAREEFESHGYKSPLVTVLHRDVCKNGFRVDHTENGAGDSSSTEETPVPVSELVDAVFLDLPHPWLAISHAKKMMKKGGRIATFSPCIEQVQKTKEALHQCGYFEVDTSEGLSRELQVQYRTHSKIAFTPNEPGKEGVKYLTCIPAATIPGHTGFLTFATLKP